MSPTRRPTRDDTERSRPAPVNTALVAINIGVFIGQIISPQVAAITAGLALVPAAITGSGSFAIAPAITLVTSMFIHAGVAHIAGNMIFLLIFGAAVEQRLGHLRFMILYLMAGVFSGFATIAIGPHSGVPVVGASGAIAGILGAYLMLFPRARIALFWDWLPIVGRVNIPVLFFLLAWFAAQLLEGALATAPGAPPGGIAWWAHIGGFLFGLALGPLLAPPPPKPARRPRQRRRQKT